MREIGIAHQRADAQATVGESLDGIEPVEMGDVDEAIRPADIALHQIEQIGAGGEIGSTRLSGRRDGLGHCGRPDIIERFHAERL